MHLTKPALVVASFLWATTFASPIDSPTILRTRGLIGGSTTNDNTKNVAGSTTADNAVGSDNTKTASGSNPVEDAVGSLNLDNVTGGLGARDVSRLRHGQKSQEGEIVDDALNIADDATPGGVFGRNTRRRIVGDDAGGLSLRDALGHHHRNHEDEENGIATNALDGAQGVTGGDDMGDATGGSSDNVVNDAATGAGGSAGDAGDDATSSTDIGEGILRPIVTRDKDGSVHDANQAANKAVHDANQAVHAANEAVHNTLHGVLHGILR
ncbi:hypothetical protein BGAL_0172g00110 [Botrytis galanthina]|uniref:Uncharacterized protein n=1 Tax=Botrytis galanthina TaxID=278940 RepID=A0A4S8R9G0_9HELO|nr:hypothetical protein BGAL_0172g00110 [Botrytis galanthina]